MNDPLLWVLVFIVVLIALIALLSAAETAVLSVSAADLRQEEPGDRKAQKIRALAENPDRFLADVRCAAALLTLLCGAMSTICLVTTPFMAIAAVQHVIWGDNGGMLSHPAVISLEAAVVAAEFLALVFLVRVLGVLMPRRLAAEHPLSTVRRLLLPAARIACLLHPLAFLMQKSADGLLRLFGVDGSARSDNATEEEIRTMLDESEEGGLIESGEGEMIDNVFEFNNIPIGDVMTHRVDVELIDIAADRREITEQVRETGYSRFPVYEDEPDNIIGLLYVKDFFLNEDKPLREILKEPVFVPDSLICDDLFRRMQRDHIHFALVTDEYGAFQGIITMEDLVEEIVGNIYDEYDEGEEYIVANPDGSWSVSGRAELKDIERIMGIDLPNPENVNTLSGLIVSQTQQIPRDGERFTAEIGGLKIEVLRVEDRRIEETRITVLS